MLFCGIGELYDRSRSPSFSPTRAREAPMMAGAGGAMRATGWRATAIRFQQFGEASASTISVTLTRAREAPNSRSRFHFLVSAARRRRCRGWRRWPPMVPAAELNRGRLRRVLSLRFQAGAIAVFIRWRVAAERRAGFCPSLGLGGCRFLFGEFGWRRRPSYRVSVAAGGLATPR